MFTVDFLAPTTAAAERLVRLYEYYVRRMYNAFGVRRINSGVTANKQGYKITVTTSYNPKEVYQLVGHWALQEMHRGNSFRGGNQKYVIALLADYGE